jgi:hypothetical protein
MRKHDVASVLLVHDAHQAKMDRDRVMKQALRTQTSLTLALTAEKERGNALAETLESTLAEKSVIIRARKKGLLTLTLTPKPHFCLCWE